MQPHVLAERTTEDLQHLRAAAAPVAAVQRPPLALVVDDNAANQLVAAGLLQMMGFDVQTCDDGLQALASCRQRAPDFVLMDVLMPVMDGLEAARRLRALQHEGVLPRFPIVAASASGVGALRADCAAAGMDGFLDKPMSYAALASMTRGLVPVPAA